MTESQKTQNEQENVGMPREEKIRQLVTWRNSRVTERVANGKVLRNAAPRIPIVHDLSNNSSSPKPYPN